MSRYRSKGMPTAGLIVSSVFKYVIVSISSEHNSTKEEPVFHIFESSKHKTYDTAMLNLDAYRTREREYAADNGRDYQCRYFLAEWKQTESGAVVCVLVDDPLLATLDPS